jgi:hypothetical protein
LSIRAWGGFILKADVIDSEKTKLSFEITKIASENLIGIKLGWNVWPDFRKEYENIPNVMPFELVDNPMTNIAEVIFIGDGIQLYVKGKRTDIGEDLDSRMSKLSNFLICVSNFNNVNEIILHVNSGFGEEVLVKAKINDFKNEILKMYEISENETPTVKFVLNKT